MVDRLPTSAGRSAGDMQNAFLCATLCSSGLAYSISPVQQRQRRATAQMHKHNDDDLAKRIALTFVP